MKSNENKNLFAILIELTKETFKALPVYYTINQIVSVVHGVSYIVILIATQRFFESITSLSQGGSTNVTSSIIFLFVAILASQILNGYHNHSHQVVEWKLEKVRVKRINEKSSNISPILFENPDMHDHINKARTGMQYAVYFQIIMSTLFTFYLPYFIAMAFYLWTINKYLILLLVFVFVPVMANQFIKVKLYRDLEKELAPVRRKFEYYERTIADRQYFKETRLLGAFNFLSRVYKESLLILNNKQWKVNKKSGLLELMFRVFTLMGYFGILILLVILLIRKEITVGAFAAIFASVDLTFGLTEEIISSHIGRITENLGTIENYVSFVNLPEREGLLDTIDKNTNIILKDVSFTYPKAKEQSLKNINLDINVGQTIAVVGENGAGKSTLMRLISGIYLPTSGDIYYGDVNIKDVKPSGLFEKTSAVFQKFQKYQMSLKDNIALADISRCEECVDEAAKKANIDLNPKTYPEGYETMLSREFGGVDLSGGQWQRVAIARGYYREHEVIILDEPTAAIDPIEETKLYKQFAKISEDKTSFIVTHRIGSAKIADRIIVLDNGEVIEDGSHEDLMSKNGHYSKMYQSQSKWYANR